MKKKLLILFCFGFVLHTNAQTQRERMPNHQLKTGRCYCLIQKENGKSEWKSTDCKLFEMTKEKRKALQEKLKSLGYEVAVNGCLDDKTRTAYDLEKKEKRELQRKKAIRKAKRIAKKKIKSQNQ